MRKWMAFLLAILILGLGGCKSSGVAEEPEKEQDTQPRIEELTEEELANFAQMFSLEHTYEGDYWWYNMALTSEYDRPENLDLYSFFYNGFIDEVAGPEELERLEQEGLWMELDIQKNPVQKMDQVLKTYFGLSLEQTNGVGLDGMIYLAETDSYYKCAGDFWCGEGAVFSRGHRTEDGRVVLYYQNYLDEEWVITLVEASEESEMPYYVFSHMPNQS